MSFVLPMPLITGSYVFVNGLSPMLLAALLAIDSPQWSEKSRWRLGLNASIVILYPPPSYIMLARWNGLYLLWPVLVALTLAVFGLLCRLGPTPESLLATSETEAGFRKGSAWK